MYKGSFRLRGKTYDYKIQYESVKKFMILPKPDEMHVLLTIGLDPPLRQGQTRYPFVVMQMNKEEEIQLELNMKDEDFDSEFKGKLQQKYEAPLHSVIAALFRGLAGKKLTVPSKDFTSHHHASGVKCSIKANEGLLFCLDKSFMFVPKPATYVNMDQITLITMSRIGGAMAASRTFDITMAMRGGGEFQFSNINREEQKPLEDFFRTKGLKVKNEMLEEEKMTKALLKGAVGDDESDDEVVADRGSADEDSEEADEDFQDDDDSDVAEEFDSQHESEGDSDEEMAEGGSDEEAEERPKKKAKTGK
jgi:structure-specific recognition protein 1